MFTLKITFTGLFCFVPDEENGQLMALLPTTGPMSTGGIHQHYADFRFDRDYLARPDGHVHGEAAATPVMERIVIDRTRLGFVKVPGEGTLITPPPAANLYRLCGQRLDPAQISSDPSETVYSQIVLPGADDMSEPDKVAWKFRSRPGEPRVRLSNKLIWIKDVPDDRITLSLQYFGSALTRTFVLYAPGPYSTMELEISHLPSDDMRVGMFERATHFDVYYDLLDPPVPEERRLLPILDEPPPEPAADTYTCMTSQVPLEVSAS